jgi:hypothetical protein
MLVRFNETVWNSSVQRQHQTQLKHFYETSTDLLADSGAAFCGGHDSFDKFAAGVRANVNERIGGVLAIG